MKRCLVAVGVLAAVPASAFDGVRSSYEANRALVSAAKITAADAISAAQSSAKAVGSVNLLGPGGRQVATSLTVTMSRGAIMRAAAFALGPVGGAAALAYTVYSAMQDARVAPTAPDELSWDEGGAAVAETRYCYASHAFAGHAYPSGCAGSPYAAASIVAGHNPYGSRIVSCGSTSCEIRIALFQGQDSSQWGALTVQLSLQVGQVCPEYTDGWTGAHYGHGVGAMGPDGKCPTGRYTQPQTAQELADRLAAAQSAASLDYAQMMREAAGLGPITVPTNPAEAQQELPAVVPPIQGAVTTTTESDGRVTETATAWDFTRDPVKKNEGTFKEKKTTVTRDASGTTTGTTTTETTEPTEAEPQADPCEAHPERMGCSEFGQVEPGSITSEERSVNVSPQSGWGASSADCPAPRSFVFMGRSYEVDNSLFCQFFAGIRWVVLGVAGIVSALIFVGGLKD